MAQRSNRLQTWFSRTETPRWQLLTGAVVLFVAQSVFSYFLLVSENRQSVENAIVAELRLSAIDFQTYAANYVAAVLENGESAQFARQTLVDSIVSQHSHLDLATQYLSQSEVVLAARYREQLRRLAEVVSEIDDPIQLGEFWKVTSDVIEARNDFLAAIITS
ncbi:hypothetical protein LSUCC0031_13600 [Rhodobacterales bacterium LSUCC0031]|nr:hypothetical protein [Rhodobacterales bacterium LSUCC0031]